MLIDDKFNIMKKLNLPDYYEILGKEQLNGKEIYICAQANEESNTVKIADILMGTYTNMGYGSILMKYVLKYLNQRKDIEKINGALVEIDRDHFDRIEHFYKNMVLMLNLDEDIEEVLFDEVRRLHENGYFYPALCGLYKDLDYLEAR